MRITAKTKMCLVIGDPIEHSLSPVMHNAAYADLGIDDQFVYTAAQVKVEKVGKVIEAMRAMNIRGISCTIPHKLEVMKYLDEIDPIAQKIGAVNTVVNDNGVIKGYNTDWLGAVTPLEKLTTLRDKQVGIVGAGGVARAIAYGMKERGAHVTIFNRTLNKALELAFKVGGEARSMDQLEEIKDSSIIFNTTPLGMTGEENASPINKEYINSKQIVFDAVYNPYQTVLLKEAEEQGARVIHGIEMLLYQGIAQFELYTNHKAPVETMRKVLYDHFKIAL